MPDVVELRIGTYHCNVGTQERVMKPKPGDKVRCKVTVSVQHHVSNFWRRDATQVSKLMELSTTLYFESFLERNQDFLTTVLSDPRCCHYFTPESIERISPFFVYLVQRLLESRSDPDPEYANSLRPEFPLNLEILVDVIEEEVPDYQEDSTQQDVTLMPASDEAIHSLKTFRDSLSLKTEKCNICMEKFCAEESDENVKLSLSTMPCDHVFHHQCIVKWLQTSHTCPLCRYPMPIKEI